MSPPREQGSFLPSSLSPLSRIMCAPSWQSVNTEGGKEGRKEICMGKIIRSNDSENRASIQRKFIQLLWWKENTTALSEKGILRMSQGNPYLKDESMCPKGPFHIESFWSSLHNDANHSHTTFTCPTSHVTKTLLIMYSSESLHIKSVSRARYILVLA